MVYALATTAHGSGEPSFVEPLSEGQARVLASLIQMVDDAMGQPPPPDRHVQRFDDQLASEMICHRLPDTRRLCTSNTIAKEQRRIPD